MYTQYASALFGDNMLLIEIHIDLIEHGM